MSKKSSIRKVNKSFKTIIILLTATLLGSFFYIYKLSDRTKEIVVSLRDEKQSLLADLEKNKLFLEQLKTTNGNLSAKLQAEQQKIAKLINEIKTRPVTEKKIFVYKQSVNDSDERIKELMNEIAEYKKQIETTKGELKVEKIKNDTLVRTNKKLEQKVTEAGKLYYYDLSTTAYKEKSSGKLVATTSSDKTNLLRINFSIAENNFIKPETKIYYVQVIDTKSNVLGDKKTQNFGNEELVYSGSIPVNYQNKSVKTEIDIPVKNLEKGIYFVNVFEKSKLVLKSTLSLE